MKIAIEHADGATASQLAERYGVSHPTIVAAIRRAGGHVRNCREAQRLRWPVCEQVFNAPLSEHGAFFVGLLMADGCVTANRRSMTIALALTIEDIETVKAFRAFLCSGNSVVIDHSRGYSNRRPKALFAVHSHPLAEALAKWGVTPRKSHTAQALGGIEKNPHFWRGVVDGDGSVTIPINRGVPIPVISLCGSYQLMKQFVSFVETVSANSKATVRPHSGQLHHVSITGRHAYRLAHALYGTCTIALPRKLKRAREVMAWTPRVKTACLDKP